MEQAIDYVDDVEKSLEEKNIQELIAQLWNSWVRANGRFSNWAGIEDCLIKK